MILSLINRIKNYFGYVSKSEIIDELCEIMADEFTCDTCIFREICKDYKDTDCNGCNFYRDCSSPIKNDAPLYCTDRLKEQAILRIIERRK